MTPTNSIWQNSKDANSIHKAKLSEEQLVLLHSILNIDVSAVVACIDRGRHRPLRPHHILELLKVSQ